MGRTRLYGLELAGIRVAVEAPPEFRWSPEDGALARFRSCPDGASVYVGVRVGSPGLRPPEDPFIYRAGEITFAIGRSAGEWRVAIHRAGRCERLARFDPDFRQGEVSVAPEALDAFRERALGPLAHPLDELVVLHRLAREQGLMLRGTAVLREGRALVFCGDDASGVMPEPDAADGWRRIPPQSHSERASDVFGAARVPVRLGVNGVHCLATPWDDGQGDLPVRAPIDALHVCEPAAAVFSEPLDGDDAVEAVLGRVLAPVHDPELAERLWPVAEAIARRLTVRRLGLPAERRVLPFTWGHRHAALAFAPPS